VQSLVVLVGVVEGECELLPGVPLQVRARDGDPGLCFCFLQVMETVTSVVAVLDTAEEGRIGCVSCLCCPPL
jgi:hypothetical protein